MLVLPSGGRMPLPYRWLYHHGLRELPPWSLIEDQAQALAVRDEFLLEVAEPNPTPIRDWFPFARHQAQNDFAGFILDGSDRVAVVHLTFKRRSELPGWPGFRRYADLWRWVTDCMIAETIEFCDEPDD